MESLEKYRLRSELPETDIHFRRKKRVFNRLMALHVKMEVETELNASNGYFDENQ